MRINEIFKGVSGAGLSEPNRIIVQDAIRCILDNRKTLGIDNDVCSLYDIKDSLMDELDIHPDTMAMIWRLPAVFAELRAHGYTIHLDEWARKKASTRTRGADPEPVSSSGEVDDDEEDNEEEDNEEDDENYEDVVADVAASMDHLHKEVMSIKCDIRGFSKALTFINLAVFLFLLITLYPVKIDNVAITKTTSIMYSVKDAILQRVFNSSGFGPKY